MRDRLIELIKNAKTNEAFDMLTADIDTAIDMTHGEEYLADRLIANGVVCPPCKVGDTVYVIEKNCLACIYYADGGYSDWCECTLDEDNKLMFECDFDKECIYSIISKQFNYSMLENIGKTVFLTREDAERALKGGE